MRRPHKNRYLLAFFCLILGALPALQGAHRVVPSERVVNSVNVRDEPTAEAVAIGDLRLGQEAELLVSVPRWYKVRLSDGTEGFVSKAWTDLLEDEEAPLRFQVHFLDVGTGDSAIIDIGEKEIIIDGGDSTRVLYDYVERTDMDRRNDNDHIICHVDAAGELQCNYADVLAEN